MWVLVSADRGGPNAAQRRRLSRVLQERPQRAAILTKSRVVHGVLTAIRWIDSGFDVQAFKPEEFLAAAGYLEIPRSDHGAIRATVDRLRGQLGSRRSSRPRRPRADCGPTRGDDRMHSVELGG